MPARFVRRCVGLTVPSEAAALVTMGVPGGDVERMIWVTEKDGGATGLSGRFPG